MKMLTNLSNLQFKVLKSQFSIRNTKSLNKLQTQIIKHAHFNS